MKLSSIKPNPNNPRTIKDDSFKKLCNSIEQFPKMMALRPMVIDSDGVILGGNMRFKALQHLGFKEVPDEWVKRADELTEDERRRFIIADNVSGGDWDVEDLAANWDVKELEDWGLELDWPAEPLEAVEDDFEIPDVIETDIVLGDLFEIGEHRLLCGDSTDSDAVAKLMNGEKADMVFTDPPYGVNIKGGLQNTTISGDITQTSIPFAFELCVRETIKDGRLYFCGSQTNVSLYFKLYERYLQQIPRLLIWVKNGFVMKPNGYHNQYEIIFHGFKSGGGGLNKWFGGRTEYEASDVWRINRDASSTYEHPTQKPVALPERAIKNSCPPNGLVYEPFTGSGSTMVAAHQLNRKCYGMELDPKYCQVIIDRMRKLDPTLIIKRNGTAI
jgi:DNA modification methylase